jgi:hypothetical protein
MGEMRNEYKILVGKREGKRPRCRPKDRREDIIRTDLREIMWTGFIWLRIGTGDGILRTW